MFVIDCDQADPQANLQAQASQNRQVFTNLIPMHRVHVPGPQHDLYKPLSSRGTLYEGRNQGLRASQQANQNQRVATDHLRQSRKVNLLVGP